MKENIYNGKWDKLRQDAQKWREENPDRQKPKIEEKDKKVTLEEALEIMGDENFYGPAEIFKTFGVIVEDINIPEIQFSKAELERAKELGQELILHIDKLPDDGTLFTAGILRLCCNNVTSTGTKLTYSDWFVTDAGTKNETPRAGWRLTTKEPLSSSSEKNYWQQTEELASFAREKAFENNPMAQQYRDAIDEWDKIKESLREPSESGDTETRKKAAQDLASAKINQIFRENYTEVLQRIAMHEKKTGKRLLDSEGRSIYYTWTNSRDSDGRLLYVGSFGSDGSNVNNWNPRNSDSNMGVCFSRSDSVRKNGSIPFFYFLDPSARDFSEFDQGF